MAASEYYTHGSWTVHPGKEQEFVDAWKRVGTVFAALESPPGRGTLIQSLNEPTQFFSFGPWPSLEAIQTMRENLEASEALGRLMELCSEAIPGAFRVVASAE